VLDHLSLNANDTFLWVALVCQGLEKIPKAVILSSLNKFPRGLETLYERMMKQIRELDYADLCNQILASVAIVYRPITLTELASLIDMFEDMSDSIESLQEIIGFCGSFLTVRKDEIYFVHQSAKDYLLEKAFNDVFPSGKEGIHHNIFLKSLEIMSRALRRDIYSLHALGYPIEQVKQPDPDPLAALRYSCIYWVNHLNEWISSTRVHRIEILDEGAIETFIRKKYLYWLEALSLCRYTSEGITSISKLEALLQVIFNPTVLPHVHVLT
jgi:hypothetical protein